MEVVVNVRMPKQRRVSGNRDRGAIRGEADALEAVPVIIVRLTLCAPTLTVEASIVRLAAAVAIKGRAIILVHCHFNQHRPKKKQMRAQSTKHVLFKTVWWYPHDSHCCSELYAA